MYQYAHGPSGETTNFWVNLLWVEMSERGLDQGMEEKCNVYIPCLQVPWRKGERCKVLYAAAAKSLQSCPTVWPHRWQPTRLLRPWDSPGKNTGVGCHFLLQSMIVKSESEVAQLCPTLWDPMDCSPPGSSAMGFSRQDYWNGLPLPSPKVLYDGY